MFLKAAVLKKNIYATQYRYLGIQKLLNDSIYFFKEKLDTNIIHSQTLL